jgi:hypothetical protein
VIVTIDVTQADIDDGKPGLPCACPIWLAISRALAALGVNLAVRVGISDVALVAAGAPGDVIADLPTSASDFIGWFDCALTVWPFSFELEIPDHLIPAGALS